MGAGYQTRFHGFGGVQASRYWDETQKRRPGPEGLDRRFRRSTAVAVGFEPTVDFHPHTLSSSANPRSGAVVGVRLVLNEAVRGGHRTRADDDE